MYDFCINGGGMVGAALGLGLVQQGYRVAIIEANPPIEYDPEQSPDLRLSAISMASVDLLRALGAWEYIEQTRLKAYDTLSVWEDPDAKTVFDAKSIGLEALGFFVENRLLQLGCYKALKPFDVEWITHAHLTDYKTSGETVRVTLSDQSSLVCRWLVGADGARSQVRQLAGIGTSGWQYAQQAMGIIVRMQQASGAETWQQFYPSGPRAFLPMYDNYASLIWYDSAERIKQLSGLNDKDLKQHITNAFPSELEDFSVVSKGAFVLTRAHASEYVRPGVILIGDAAHTINPLAGQGVNLGFRDVSALLALTRKDALRDASFFTTLQQGYETPRKRDNLLMMSAMDGFYLLFSNDLPPVKWFRKAMLKGTQSAGPLKSKVLEYAMGMSGWKS